MKSQQNWMQVVFSAIAALLILIIILAWHAQPGSIAAKPMSEPTPTLVAGEPGQPMKSVVSIPAPRLLQSQPLELEDKEGFDHENLAEEWKYRVRLDERFHLAPLTTNQVNGPIAFAGTDNNLWLMDASGSNPQRLTTTFSDVSNPTWSPNGTRIVFAAAGQVYVIDADGTNLNSIISGFASTYLFAWSPDSTRILFNGEESGDVWGTYIVNANGGVPTRLAAQLGEHSLGASWSPDGQWVALPAKKPNGSWGIYKLRVADQQGSWLPGEFSCTLTVCDCPQVPYTYFPVWSPEGSQIAFAGARTEQYPCGFNTCCRAITGLYLVNADGSAMPQLIGDLSRTDNPLGYASWMNLEWASNTVSITTQALWQDGTWRTCVASAGTGVRALNGQTGNGPGEVDWSPDVSRLAASLRQDSTYNLYIVDPVVDNWRTPVVQGDSPDWNGIPISFPNDPLFGKQWELTKIEILDAWSYTLGSTDVVIAIIDTGVDYTHVDLSAGKTLTANDEDFVNNNDGDAMDDNGHGTHVAGIAAAKTHNGEGIAGICPQCRILPLKVLNAANVADPYDVAEAIEYAITQGAKVINLSLGSPSCIPELAKAVNDAYDQNIALVAASGNDCSVRVALGQEPDNVMYPAKFERVIAVGATNLVDNRYAASLYGPELDISAPGELIGVGILSTNLGGGYTRMDGTSFAAPMVAGVAGLLLSKNPSLTPAKVQKILERSADDIGDPGWDKYTGYGRLNARRALETIVSVVPEAPRAFCPPLSSTIQSNADELIILYTQLRDEVLLSNQVGHMYVKDYYRYNPELVTILLTNSNLRARTGLFLEHAAPAFRSLLPNSVEEVRLTQALYNEADTLVRDLANVGSAEFRDKVLQTWEDMALNEHIGETATDIWEQMLQNAIYLPMIIKNN